MVFLVSPAALFASLGTLSVGNLLALGFKVGLDLRCDCRLLTGSQVSAVHIEAQHEGHQRPLPVPLMEGRLDASDLARLEPVAAINDLPFVDPDRLTKAVKTDVGGELFKGFRVHLGE